MSPVAPTTKPRVAQSMNPQPACCIGVCGWRNDDPTVARSWPPTQLVTNSRFTAAAIQTAYGRAATVVTPGVAAAFQAHPQAPEASGYVLSVGSLIRSKGMIWQ